MSEQWAESCPVCQAELATVTLATSEGETRVGPKCARILEHVVRLFGVIPKRHPVLREVE